MIMNVLAIRPLEDWTIFLSLQMPQTKTMQDITSENYSTLKAMFAALVSPYMLYIQTIAGKAALSKHIMMLAVFSPQLKVSSGRPLVVSSIRYERTKYLKANIQWAMLNAVYPIY